MSRYDEEMAKRLALALENYRKVQRLGGGVRIDRADFCFSCRVEVLASNGLCRSCRLRWGYWTTAEVATHLDADRTGA